MIAELAQRYYKAKDNNEESRLLKLASLINKFSSTTITSLSKVGMGAPTKRLEADTNTSPSQSTKVIESSYTDLDAGLPVDKEAVDRELVRSVDRLTEYLKGGLGLRGDGLPVVEDEVKHLPVEVVEIEEYND